MATELQLELSKIVEKCPTFSEVLTYRAQESPNSKFLVFGEKTLSYHEFDQYVNRCCRYFDEVGLRSGDTISFILRNSVDYLVLYFSAIRCRIILNPFPFHMGTNEVVEKLQEIQPRLVFCHTKHYESLEKGQSDVINLDEINGEGFLDYLRDFSSDFYETDANAKIDVAVYYYSSGTTGGSKIIEYTHRSMVLSQASMLRAGFVESGAVHLCFLPLGHTASLRYTIKPCVCTGSTVILYESFWRQRSNFWHEVEKNQATFVQIVPTILIALLNTRYPDFSTSQSRSLRFVGCGSALLPEELQEVFSARFGVPVANLYGLSETGATHFDDPSQKDRVAGSIGKPFDIVDGRIFSSNGEEAADGEIGELGIKGSGLLTGYLNNDEYFEKCFLNGFFMTGDLCRKDRENNFYFVDRKKDIIIKGGVNILPSQIEQILLSHQLVQEVAVVGKPDMLMGEVIQGFVVTKKDRRVDAKELEKYCRESLGDFKTPSEIVFMDALPKGPSGKVLKRELRAQSNLDGLVGAK